MTVNLFSLPGLGTALQEEGAVCGWLKLGTAEVLVKACCRQAMSILHALQVKCGDSRLF